MTDGAGARHGAPDHILNPAGWKQAADDRGKLGLWWATLLSAFGAD